MASRKVPTISNSKPSSISHNYSVPYRHAGRRSSRSTLRLGVQTRAFWMDKEKQREELEKIEWWEDPDKDIPMSDPWMFVPDMWPDDYDGPSELDLLDEGVEQLAAAKVAATVGPGISREAVAALAEAAQSSGNAASNALWAAETGATVLAAGSGLLVEAAANANQKLVEALLSAGAHVDAPEPEEGSTALAKASSTGDIGIVQKLLEAGASVEATDIHGNTALMAACAPGMRRWHAVPTASHEAVVQALLEAGASVDVKNYLGNTALSQVAQAGHSAMAKVLIKAGASLEAANRDGRTPLMMAARTNRAETVQALAEAGASLTATDRMGMTALIHAGRCGAAEACEALLQQGSHSDVQDKSGKTALMAAAEEGHLQVVQVLLAAKANTELKDVLKQDTALILAAGKGHVEVGRTLIASGASLAAIDCDGDGALTVARDKKRWNMVRMLEEAGAKE